MIWRRGLWRRIAWTMGGSLFERRGSSGELERSKANVRYSRNYKSSRSTLATMKLLSVDKKSRDEIIERPSPGLPFMGGALRFNESILDAGVVVGIVDRFGAIVNLGLSRAGAEPK